jgi:hypothetical protein
LDVIDRYRATAVCVENLDAIDFPSGLEGSGRSKWSQDVQLRFV